MQDLTPATCKRSEKTFSLPRYIGQHNAMGIFPANWKELYLLRIIFAQNLMKAVGFIILLLAGQLNHLNLGGLQVDDISIKITAESTKQLYQLDKN